MESHVTGRLVVNGRFLRRRPTGLHRVARSLLDGLAAHGHDFDVLAPPGIDDTRVDRVVWAPRGRLGDHFWEQCVLPAAAAGRPVLSLANTAPVTVRGIVMIHDLAPLANPAWFKPSMRIYTAIALTAARRARLVLTVSRTVAEELSERGVDRNRIRTVRNAVDPTFRPSPSSAVDRVRRRYRIDEPYLLVVGWADPRKDVTTAVAAHLLALEERGHQLVLAGTPERNFAATPTFEHGSIRLAGYVPDDDLVALMTGATALAYPTRYEGFGLPPLEAVACGTPAIVSDLPALRESAGERAVFVSPGDVNAWADAFIAALDDSFVAPEPPKWTWDDAAEVLREAVAPLVHDPRG